MNDDAWQRFVRDGMRVARAVHDCVAHADAAPELAEALEPLTALEMDAHVVGVPEIASLSAAMRARIEMLEAREAQPGHLDALRAAGGALVSAFEELARPDSSGAHLDSHRIETARLALLPSVESLPPPPPPPLPRPHDTDDGQWRPTVDEDMIDPFLEECQERLEGLGQKLVELERAPDDPELVRAIFRDLHTLKGSSAFVGLTRMNRLAHAAEDLVALVRDGRRAADRSLIDALLAAMDTLSAILSRAASRAPIDVDVQQVIDRLSGARQLGDTTRTEAPRSEAGVPGSVPPPAATGTSASSGKQQTLRIDFDKLDLLMNLVGELVLAKGRMTLGLSGLGSLRRELGDQRRNATATALATGTTAVRGGLAHGSRARARIGSVRSQDLPTELGRLERAFDQLSGELDAAGQQLDFVAAELRDQVMKLRMVPIGRSWSKYHRTVREIALRLGKQVRLELAGGETELDKMLVEQLDDPFLHLVRNAIDHGVESPDDRTARGKPPEGTLRLWAGYRGNQVVIRVADDGKGIDVRRVRDKAIEKGLLTPEAAMDLDDAQVRDLIFRAGFSTAGNVSDMSGRGVGMDVVRDTISRLKGTVSVESEEGRGTRFEIRLPLTLAIVQVLLLRCAGDTYAIPIDLVERTVSAAAGRIRVAATHETLYDSGRDIPLVRLRQVLGLPSAAGDHRDDEAVVIVDVAGQIYAIACDGFLGRQEIVIKSLGSLLRAVPGTAGATLVGERCVLILDVPALVQMDTSAPAPVSTLAEQTPDAPHILVAEDADVIREAIRRVLTGAGFRVTVARDGAEALRIASEESFDLVSTDVVMPEMDGYELTRRLRQLPAYRDVPIVMVTSKAERIDRIRGFDAGVDAYLTKPTDATELLRVIERHLPDRRR